MTGVLEILYKLLRDHEVTEDDFREEVLELPNSSTVAASKKPGFSLLMRMLNDSPLYKMVSVLLFVSTLVGWITFITVLVQTTVLFCVYCCFAFHFSGLKPVGKKRKTNKNMKKCLTAWGL